MDVQLKRTDSLSVFLNLSLTQQLSKSFREKSAIFAKRSLQTIPTHVQKML